MTLFLERHLDCTHLRLQASAWGFQPCAERIEMRIIPAMGIAHTLKHVLSL